MDSDQYIVESESRYTPFSDMQARGYFNATRGYTRDYEYDYNVDSMKVPYAQPMRTAESKFMAEQVGIPSYLLNYQCGKGIGVPYGPSVDKSIIDRVAIGGDPRDYGTPRGNPGDALSVPPDGRISDSVAYGTKEYYPRALVVDSHSHVAGRVPPEPLMPASQQGKTQWPWPIEKCVGSGGSGGGSGTNTNITLTLDPNMMILFIFIVVIALCYLGMRMAKKIEKLSSMLRTQSQPPREHIPVVI